TRSACSSGTRSRTVTRRRRRSSITQEASSPRPRRGWPTTSAARSSQRRLPARSRHAASRRTGSWSCSATTSAPAGSHSLRSVRNDLADRFRAGDVRALARAITMVERRDAEVRELQQALRDRVQTPYVVGFTGAPGTGKSTLVDALVALLRKRERSGAVIATDP